MPDTNIIKVDTEQKGELFITFPDGETLSIHGKDYKKGWTIKNGDFTVVTPLGGEWQIKVVDDA